MRDSCVIWILREPLLKSVGKSVSVGFLQPGQDHIPFDTKAIDGAPLVSHFKYNHHLLQEEQINFVCESLVSHFLHVIPFSLSYVEFNSKLTHYRFNRIILPYFLHSFRFGFTLFFYGFSIFFMFRHLEEPESLSYSC